MGLRPLIAVRNISYITIETEEEVGYATADWDTQQVMTGGATEALFRRCSLAGIQNSEKESTIVGLDKTPFFTS